MGIISRIENQRIKTSVRNYAGAKSSNITADWMTTNLIADEILRWQLPKLRSRSRDLERNNSYAKNFLRKLKINIIGHNGIIFQNKAKDSSGKQNKEINSRVEAAFNEWSQKKYASVCGTLSWKDIQKNIIETVARDGEILIRKVKGYNNKFKFALQLIEADYLDENLNLTLPNGNIIRMGIEFNPWGKPIAYHLFAKHPGDNTSSLAGQKYQTIPADEIIHLFVKERPTQSRGVPWMHTSIVHLRMLGAYEEAAVVNARIGASKMQTIIMGEGQEYTGDSVDLYGNKIDEVEPGMRELMPYGTELHDFNPQFPNGEHASFNKAMLRGISSGFGTNYNSLANDLEGVNFSSLRSGALEERDCYRLIQSWLTEHTHDETVYDWADMAVLSGALKIPYSQMDTLIVPRWQPRTWEWVDPEKDINAKILSLEKGLATYRTVLAEMGIDFDDHISQLVEEKNMFKSLGLDFKVEKTSAAKPSMNDNDITDQETANTGGNGNGKKN